MPVKNGRHCLINNIVEKINRVLKPLKCSENFLIDITLVKTYNEIDVSQFERDCGYEENDSTYSDNRFSCYLSDFLFRNIDFSHRKYNFKGTAGGNTCSPRGIDDICLRTEN